MTDAPTLANSSRCMDCSIPQGMVWATLLYVLAQTANGNTVSADPNTLANDARCFQCVVEHGMFLPVMAYLLEKTAAGEPASTDPSVLVNEARCFDCVGTTPAMVLKALSDVNAAIT